MDEKIGRRISLKNPLAFNSYYSDNAIEDEKFTRILALSKECPTLAVGVPVIVTN